MSAPLTQITTFAEQARAFCHWATGKDGSELNAAIAARNISSLYAAALNLLAPFTEGMSSELAEVKLPLDAIDCVQKRACELPVNIYWEIFDPIANPPEEPVAGSLVDDLGDIYRDVARGLALYDSGEHAEALWEWGFNFRIHWGAHATGALRALHAYLSQEDPDGLSHSK